MVWDLSAFIKNYIPSFLFFPKNLKIEKQNTLNQGRSLWSNLRQYSNLTLIFKQICWEFQSLVSLCHYLYEDVRALFTWPAQHRSNATFTFHFCSSCCSTISWLGLFPAWDLPLIILQGFHLFVDVDLSTHFPLHPEELVTNPKSGCSFASFILCSFLHLY